RRPPDVDEKRRGAVTQEGHLGQEVGLTPTSPVRSSLLGKSRRARSRLPARAGTTSRRRSAKKRLNKVLKIESCLGMSPSREPRRSVRRELSGERDGKGSLDLAEEFRGTAAGGERAADRVSGPRRVSATRGVRPYRRATGDPQSCKLL